MKVRVAVITLAATVIALSAAFFVYLRITVTPERIAASLTSAMENSFGQTCSIGRISVELLKGIHLHDVRLADLPTSAGRLSLSCEETSLTFSLTGILLNKLILRDVTLKHPQLTLNIDESPTAQSARNKRANEPKVHPLTLVFLPRSMHVDGGVVVFSSPTTGTRLSFDRVSVHAPSISLIMPFDVTGTAFLEGQSEPALLCSGTYWLARHEVQATITLRDVSGSMLQPLLTAAGMAFNQGSINVSLSFSGHASGVLQTALSCEISKASFVFSPKPSLGIDGVDLKITGNGEVDVARQTCVIRDITGMFCGSPINGTMHINGGSGTPRIQVQLDSKAFSLDVLSERLQMPPDNPLHGLKLSGVADVHFDFAPPPSGTAIPTVAIALKDTAILYPPLRSFRPRLSGGIRIDPQRITLTDITIGTQALSATIAGDIANYLHGRPQSSVRLVSSKLDFAQMFSYQPGEQQPEDIGPFDFKGLQFSSPFRFGKTMLYGVVLDNIRGTYVLENNRLTISDMTGTIAERGIFTLNLGVDLGVRGLAYTARLVFRGLPVTALRGFVEMDISSLVEGTLSGECTLEGKGTTPAGFFESLRGDAYIMLEGGNLKGMSVPTNILAFLKQEAAQNVQFTDARLHLKLQDATISITEGAIISKAIQIHPAGTIELDGSLNISATLKIAEDMFHKQTRIVSYLPRAEGWVNVPVIIKGSLQAPRITLAEDVITYMMQEALPRLLMDVLGQPSPDNETLDNATAQ
ncbi:MAG: AsmA-like C-terminal region-containing protein [Desulfobacterota bacterium]|nr:AsmA-like C-terminal region-containing protein [Thermodesulfobacteriota bacterium]